MDAKPHSDKQIPELIWLGEQALEVRFGARISLEINARAQRAARVLAAAGLTGVVDVVPTYASVGLVLHDRARLSYEEMERRVRELLADEAAGQVAAATRVVRIPVAYGGAEGEDLAEVAERGKLSAAEVIERHTAAEYTVAMLGFQPGFAYLIGLDASLHLPRRATPRTRVPAGSVAIGGAQTGIYPSASPGGWHVIGRTSARLFDPAREPPALLAPGDRVRFVAVRANELERARVEVADA